MATQCCWTIQGSKAAFQCSGLHPAQRISLRRLWMLTMPLRELRLLLCLRRRRQLARILRRLHLRSRRRRRSNRFCNGLTAVFWLRRGLWKRVSFVAKLSERYWRSPTDLQIELQRSFEGVLHSHESHPYSCLRPWRGVDDRSRN